jgi:hypothetical protein
MKKTLAAIVASATLSLGAIVVTLQRPAMPEDGVDGATVTESITAMPRPRVALWPIATSAIPPTEIGTCRYVEVALVADQSDAGEQPMQTVWTYCPKTEGEATPDPQNLAVRWCMYSARNLCIGYDAGGVPLDDSEKVCIGRANTACLDSAQGAGHVVWWSEPFAAPDGAAELTRLVRREQADLMCACADSRDAGPCYVWREAADAARFLRPGDEVAQPGRWLGKGCRVSPCAESGLIRRYPGEQYPEACRP